MILIKYLIFYSFVLFYQTGIYGKKAFYSIILSFRRNAQYAKSFSFKTSLIRTAFRSIL
ncbi:hypothetical protein [Nonlabens sp. SY33080]|uniref:hypothetical protein n=1 Tax=Nonlabens sp. SY33080 TaxID=2719911 RepID=UPI0014289F58|nr:hypothetical protein [Nonlabens sp. SY33080]